jgi:hypothetical protein
MEIVIEVYSGNSIRITYKIPCCVEMKSKQQNKICGILNTKSMVSYYKIPIATFILPKLSV